MSKDLVLQSIKNDLAQVKTGLDDDTKAVAGSSLGNNKRISIKAGVFRKIVGGKEVGAIEDRFMNVIFVKMAHDPSRTYYGSVYKEGEKTSPLCWSSNSKTPDPEVKNPQAARCDKCPQSIKGSSQSGTTSACRISWRTAVVLPQDPAGDVMQLVIPAMSCFGDETNGKRPFKPYIQYLASHDISAGSVITKMQFDTNATAPKLVFSAVGAVPQADFPILVDQAKSSAAENAIKMTVFQNDSSDEIVEVATPVYTSEPPTIEEPTVRETGKASEPAVEPEVSDLVKKWSKKK
jgi:hypothetical protein